MESVTLGYHKEAVTKLEQTFSQKVAYSNLALCDLMRMYGIMTSYSLRALALANWRKVDNH